MDLYIAPRAGLWCRGIGDFAGFSAAANTGSIPPGLAAEPLPDLLPGREGRRAPLLVRLALQVAAEACRGNAIAADTVATVFGSAQGDLEITDYMCGALASPAPQLSPTRFHNSVHNAAAGYWSIATGNREPATAVAAGAATAAMALLEAGLLAGTTHRPALVTMADIAATPPLATVLGARAPLAMAVLLASASKPGWRTLEIEYGQAPATPVPAPWLLALAPGNPGTPLLDLLAGLAGPHSAAITLPAGPRTSLAVRLGAARG